jgi:ABC-2 type transport system ATP-binding protein
MIGLDPHAIRELKNIFQELKAGGSSLLVSTHIIDSVEGFWDQTLIMQSGRIVANVTHESLMASGETLEDLFFRLTEAGEEAT